jgi:MFS family permease
MAFLPSSIQRSLVLPVSLRPLQDKNFSFFWMGAFLSSIGFWIQAVGQAWQVLQLTNSAFLLGLVTFTATLPSIVLALFGGVVADRFNRRYLLIGVQIIFMSTAALLGVFTTLHIITVWQIIVISLINGTINCAGIPAWQAFIGELVPPEHLKQGIALNSTQFNLSRVVGPAIAGLSIGVFGIAGSYYLNAASYLAVIIPLVLIHPRQTRRSIQQNSMWRDLREGLSYVGKRSSVQIILLLQFLIAFLVFPYVSLLPIFARDIFHVGATGLGVMNAAAGIGALAGAISLVLFSQRIERRGSLLMILCVIGGLASLALALATTLEVSLMNLVALGACGVMATTGTNTTLQTLTPEAMRGRVLSIWVMVTFGLAPLGNLLAGWVAQSLGARLTLAIGGSMCAIATLVIALTYRGRKNSN